MWRCENLFMNLVGFFNKIASVKQYFNQVVVMDMDSYRLDLRLFFSGKNSILYVVNFFDFYRRV